MMLHFVSEFPLATKKKKEKKKWVSYGALRIFQPTI